MSQGFSFVLSFVLCFKPHFVFFLCFRQSIQFADFLVFRCLESLASIKGSRGESSIVHLLVPTTSQQVLYDVQNPNALLQTAAENVRNQWEVFLNQTRQRKEATPNALQTKRQPSGGEKNSQKIDLPVTEKLKNLEKSSHRIGFGSGTKDWVRTIDRSIWENPIPKKKNTTISISDNIVATKRNRVFAAGRAALNPNCDCELPCVWVDLLGSATGSFCGVLFSCFWYQPSPRPGVYMFLPCLPRSIWSNTHDSRLTDPENKTKNPQPLGKQTFEASTTV